MNIPSHVPPELVVDIDFYNIPGISEDVQAAWQNAIPDLPIAYTPRNGGHWILTHGDDVDLFLRDFRRTTSSNIMIPAPEGGPKILPAVSDPPDHGFYRQSIASFFTGTEIAKREDEIRSVTVELIEGFRPRGQCEFIGEFANELPIVMFLHFMNLPIGQREALRQSTVKAVRGATVKDKTDGYAELQTYMVERIEERQAAPRNDMISHILATTIDGRAMTYDEALGIGSALLLGGLDTLASLLGLIGRHLAENHADRNYIRKHILEHGERMPRILQELTRRFAPVSVTRTIRMDQDFKGVALKKGDLVLCPTMLHSMDESRFECPSAIDFDRKVLPNLTFGSGIHTCVGNILARTEIQIFLEEWLSRIPEFALKPGHEVVIESGPVSAVRELWLEWPGPS